MRSDPSAMAGLYLSITDDEALERRRPLVAAVLCALFIALATPIGWALATDDALATPAKASKVSDDDGDDDDRSGRGGGGDDDDTEATDGGSHSKSTPGNSASNADSTHSVTRKSVSSSDNSRSNKNTSHSVTRDESKSNRGNSASNPNTSHSVTRR